MKLQQKLSKSKLMIEEWQIVSYSKQRACIIALISLYFEYLDQPIDLFQEAESLYFEEIKMHTF